jgi:hypothetical protein
MSDIENPGICPWCKKEINRGDRYFRDEQSGKWFHSRCHWEWNDHKPSRCDEKHSEVQ